MVQTYGYQSCRSFSLSEIYHHWATNLCHVILNGGTKTDFLSSWFQNRQPVADYNRWCVWAGRGSVIEFIFDAVFFSRQKFFGRNERYQKITTKTA